jgi:RNA polymerase sigma-70 factor (ECF subfamily)
VDSDEDLLHRLAEDPSALGPLYDRHAKLVYGLALAILGQPADAEDLTQEVFVMLCRGHSYDPARGSVGAYLNTLTRSRAIDRLRHRGRTVRVLQEVHRAVPVTAAPAGPHERVSVAQSAERVRAALANLPANERRALEMAYYRGLSQSEIAEELGTPLGTVKSWCRRGLQSLQTALSDLAGPD